MNTSFADELSFSRVPPGLIFRIEVQNAEFFPAVNLPTVDLVLPRLSLGGRLSDILDGYWCANEEGKMLRFAALTDKDFSPSDAHIRMEIDLRKKDFPEINKLYNLFSGFLFQPIPCALLKTA